VIYTLHAPIRIDYAFRPSHYIYNHLMPLQKLLLKRHVANFHVLNKDCYKDVRSMGIDNLIYMPLGVDTELFRPLGEKEDTFTLIYASTASWNKGTDILVYTILPYLLKKLRDIRVQIISYGFLTHLYEKLRHDRRVEILPHQPQSSFAKILAKAHVLLFPSRYESYGQIPLEACASGVITVAFYVRGFVKDILSKHGALGKFVTPMGDVKAFIRSIMSLYEVYTRNREEYERLSMEARTLALRYSWTSIAETWAKIFKALIEGEIADSNTGRVKKR